MNEAVYLHIGLAGFNTLERCGITRWGWKNFPHIKVFPITQIQELEQLTALVTDYKTFMSWRDQLPPQFPVLLLADADVALSRSVSRTKVTFLVKTDAADGLEANIAQWLTALSIRVSQPQQKRARNIFSPREIQVLELLRTGASNEEIALHLNIEVTTVKTYLRRIYERLGASNRAHAVALYKNG